MKEDSREKMRQIDHDTLISLNKTVELGFRSLKDDMKELKDGLHRRVADLEIRMAHAERIHDQTNPLEAIKILNSHERFIADVKAYWKAISLFAVLISGIVGYLGSILSRYLPLP